MKTTIILIVLCTALPATTWGLLQCGVIRKMTVRGRNNCIGQFPDDIYRALNSELPATRIPGVINRAIAKVRLYSTAILNPEDEKKVKPQDLLKKYGPAYLVTSIVLAIISYTICYFMISTGVDVVSLLEKIGIKSSVAAANTGTAAIAYAIHKAASPIRFPPTVVLTPIVARWFGRKSASDTK
jgi:Protein of unknown function (DUF1279)